jgi:hypothetical protein
VIFATPLIHPFSLTDRLVFFRRRFQHLPQRVIAALIGFFWHCCGKLDSGDSRIRTKIAVLRNVVGRDRSHYPGHFVVLGGALASASSWGRSAPDPLHRIGGVTSRKAPVQSGPLPSTWGRLTRGGPLFSAVPNLRYCKSVTPHPVERQTVLYLIGLSRPIRSSQKVEYVNYIIP